MAKKKAPTSDEKAEAPVAMATEPTAPYRRHVRKWRERFDPDAPFVWNRPIVFMGARVTLGERISSTIVRQLGRHRLRLWWNQGFVARADVDDAGRLIAAGTA